MSVKNIAPNRMRKLREDRLKSQREVASDVGISLTTYQRAEGGGPVSQRTVQKIAHALLVEPEELLALYEGRLKGSEVPKYQRPRSGNLATLQASDKKTKHHLIKLARVYGLHQDAAPGTPKHKQFLQLSEEASHILRATGFHSPDISAAYDFLLETGPAGLRALLGDWLGTPDPRLIRSFADALFELAEKSKIDLSTAISRVGLVRAAFAL
jgi:transcriptional regulator with XRE-family HTH domain